MASSKLLCYDSEVNELKRYLYIMAEMLETKVIETLQHVVTHLDLESHQNCYVILKQWLNSDWAIPLRIFRSFTHFQMTLVFEENLPVGFNDFCLCHLQDVKSYSWIFGNSTSKWCFCTF